MHLALSDGRLGLGLTLRALADLAEDCGYGGLEPDSDVFFASTPSEQQEFVTRIGERSLSWHLSALPGQLGTSTDEAGFDRLLAEVGRRAPVLAAAGVGAFSTWIAPANDEAPFPDVLDLHRRRLDRLAPVLREHGLRLALEYVGPATSRHGRRHPFVHTLAGTRELIAATRDPGAFGLLLDSFHWYTAGETAVDLRALSPGEVLGVDLNEAPRRPREEQRDRERALPGGTGRIDAEGFLRAVHDIGYAGPVFAEPFDASLDPLPAATKASVAATALRRALVRAGVSGV